MNFVSIENQQASLLKLRDLIWSDRTRTGGAADPEIIRAARAIAMACDARDDLCELEAIYDAVKNGTSKVPWLQEGFRYVSDPYPFDTFSTTQALIRECSSGACAGDCDDSLVLVGSLCAALGFKVGARAWGPGKDPDSEYTHVYPVVAVPKHNWPQKGYYGTAMDVTDQSFGVGSEPQGGKVMTAWVTMSG